MTQQLNLVALARQGEPQAIASLINRSLQLKGITVKVSCTGDSVLIVAESTNSPDKSLIVDFVCEGLTSLDIPAIKRVVIQGQNTGNNSLEWLDTFELDPDFNLNYFKLVKQKKCMTLSKKKLIQNLSQFSGFSEGIGKRFIVILLVTKLIVFFALIKFIDINKKPTVANHTTLKVQLRTQQLTPTATPKQDTTIVKESEQVKEIRIQGLLDDMK